jgi:hypothetical protein
MPITLSADFGFVRSSPLQNLTLGGRPTSLHSILYTGLVLKSQLLTLSISPNQLWRSPILYSSNDVDGVVMSSTSSPSRHSADTVQPTIQLATGDIEKQASIQDHSAHARYPDRASREKKDLPPSPLQPTATSLTTASAKESAAILDDFSTSSANPHNWTHGKKWRVTLTVALTGFICTTGSSIGVPGIHDVMADFGVQNEKVGVLITGAYVLGLG